jgi:quercetin dioxygenase-like cupin family protein
MAVRRIQRKLGNLDTVLYDFDEAGDPLAMHAHGPRDVHITIVIDGPFEYDEPPFPTRIVTSGMVLNPPAEGVRHGFKALGKGRLVNIIKA